MFIILLYLIIIVNNYNITTGVFINNIENIDPLPYNNKNIQEKEPDMKKLKISLICLLCLLMTACGNEFAKREYDSDKKISQPEDHYAKESSVFKPIDGGYSLTVSKFNGRQTLWTETFEENQNLEINFSFRLSKGLAKIVHIDRNGNVATVIECSPDTSASGFVTKTVPIKSGQNRLKIVGYDCENIDLKMLFGEL